MPHETLSCFSAEQHKIIAQCSIFCGCDGTVLLVRASGNTRISFNRKWSGFEMCFYSIGR